MTTPTPGQPLSEADVSLLQPGDWLLDSARRICRFDHLMRPDYIWARIGQGSSCGGGAESFTYLGRPDQDGWIAWSGGENPVPGVRVDVRFRDGEIRLNDQHSDKRWRHDPTIFLRSHIAAYRPHAPVSRPGDGANEALVEMLTEARDFIDRYSDVNDGSYGVPEPNDAMVMVHEINAVLEHVASPASSSSVVQGDGQKIIDGLKDVIAGEVTVSRPAGEREWEAVARIIREEYDRMIVAGDDRRDNADRASDRVLSLLSTAAPDAGGGDVRCVNAHDLCWQGGPCPYCEPDSALQPGGER